MSAAKSQESILFSSDVYKEDLSDSRDMLQTTALYHVIYGCLDCFLLTNDRTHAMSRRFLLLLLPTLSCFLPFFFNSFKPFPEHHIKLMQYMYTCAKFNFIKMTLSGDRVIGSSGT